MGNRIALVAAATLAATALVACVSTLVVLQGGLQPALAFLLVLAIVAAASLLVRMQVHPLAARLTRELRESEAALHHAQVLAQIAHVVSGADGGFETASATLLQLTGDPPPKSVREWLSLVHPEDAPSLRTAALDAAQTHRRQQLTYRLRRRDGRWIHVRHTVEALHGRWFTTMQDVTELFEAQEKIERLAYYDALTGLANRDLFLDRVADQIADAAHNRRKLALWIVDIERFNSVNHAYGKKAGDALLRAVAERMQAAGIDKGRIARIGADQFGVANDRIQDESEMAHMTSRRLQQVFHAPFHLAGHEVRASARVGIAVFPADGADVESLLRGAESALNRAKATGERYLFHAQEMTGRVAEKLALENRLRQALENDEFVLHYQPKLDAQTRAVTGVEALIRWRNPELGLVPPGQFIPLLEETGLILPVGLWALRCAVRDYRSWVSRGLPAPRIAVNVSPIQLRQRDFVEELARALEGEGGTTAGIDVEITEGLIMENLEATIPKLHAVRALGVRIAIDDFGTGYSSLAYLSRLPVETLKIDRSFIDTLLDSSTPATLVQSIISLAHSLRLETVAEGVETEEQARLLRLLRCDQMQGYLFSSPLPAEDLTRWLASRAVRAA